MVSFRSGRYLIMSGKGDKTLRTIFRDESGWIVRNARNLQPKTKYLMQHEALPVQKNANPFRLSMDHGIRHLDDFHMSLVAPISEVFVDGEIVKVVSAFEVLDRSPQGVKFRSADSPSSLLLQFLQRSRKFRPWRSFPADGLFALLIEKVPEWVSGRFAVLSAKRIEEAGPWPWRNEEIGGEEVCVFSAVTTPVYVVSQLPMES